ncbi:MAG TPA: TorF family putative porin [Brevundimonas sp.]|jgi:uncharacterized protein (TIGR02001 family)|uniref:TorF family putative porin n=1 Tax=Brevundimonas sp. TaxID=1871086 RepID=UPI002DF147E3|nr:TorF family putative porin [Brevundimonas sp.]
MRRLLPFALFLAGLPGPAASQSWSWESVVGVASEYRDRGWDLSAGRPSAYGEITASHATGVYGGVWAADIADYAGAEVELTGYVGWAGAVGGWDVDLAVWQNVYPDGVDVDYVEFPLQVGRALGPATVSAGAVWAPSQTGTGDDENLWVWTRLDWAPEAWPVALHARVGHEDGGFAPDGKTDWLVGAEAPVGGGLSVGLDWIESDLEDGALVAKLEWRR